MESAGAEQEVLHRAFSALGGQLGAAAVEIVDESALKLTKTDDAEIDFGFMRNGDVLAITILMDAGVRNYAMANVPTGAELRLSVPATPTNLKIEVFLARACKGRLEIVDFPPLVELQLPESACIVGVGPGSVLTLFGGNAQQVVVELRGGELRPVGDLGQVRLLASSSLGNVTIRRPTRPPATLSNNSAVIEQLVVERDARLALDSSAHRFGSIIGGSVPTYLALDSRSGLLAPSGQTVIVEGGGSATVDLLRDIELDCESLRGVREMRNCVIRRPIKIEFTENSLSEDVDFRASKGQRCHLTLGEASVLSRASGSIALHLGRHANVSGASRPLTVYLDGSSVSLNSRPFEGLVLTGARLPEGLVGRRVLALLADSYHFSPDVRGIPGRDQTVLSWLLSKRNMHYKQRDVRLHEDAEFVRELARVAREKGAAGSVTTRAAWCAYRLRALKTTGLVERMALRAYRLIGYGERPMPALIAWLILSLALGGPVLWAGSYSPAWGWEEWGNSLLESARLALGPLAGLSKSGSLATSDVVELFARALISVPLVTGLLALRNYVKGSE